MKTTNTILIINIFTLLLFSCSPHHDNKDDLIHIDIIDTYTNSDLLPLIIRTDSILNAGNDRKNNEEISNPLARILSYNLYQDESGNFVIATSAYIGFALSTDTSTVLKYLRQSEVMPKDINYEWTLLNTQTSLLALIAHRQTESKVSLGNADIDSLKINKGDLTQANGIKGLGQYYAGSLHTITIKLNQAGINKIKRIKSEDAVLMKIDLSKRNITLTLPVDKINDGIFINENITTEFADSVRQFYPSLIKSQ